MSDINKAVYNVAELHLANIVRHYSGFIIMAQSERDYESKVNSIRHGDTFCFYTVEDALKLF